MIVDYIDAHKNRFGVDPIARVLTEHGMAIAPSTYYAARKRGISAAVWADARTANALSTCGGPTGVSTGCANSGSPHAEPATISAVGSPRLWWRPDFLSTVSHAAAGDCPGRSCQ